MTGSTSQPQRVFLQREQPAAVKDGRGVRYAAALALAAEVPAADALVVRVRVAVQAVQRAARLALVAPALRLHVAHLEIDVAVLEPEHAHHAIAAQHGVVAEAGEYCGSGIERYQEPLISSGILPSTTRSYTSHSTREGAL